MKQPALTFSAPVTVDTAVDAVDATAPLPQRWLLPALAVAVFAGALLVFLVEPLIAKCLLPSLGGTPAVWNTCMVFFQATLLAGYLYAHAVARLSLRRSVALHVAALATALALLPFVVPGDVRPPATGTPVFWIFQLLLAKVGLPFLLLSATAPLLQRWLSHTTHPSARDPYPLYAASNAGSLLALLAYPLLVEPWIPLSHQAQLWAVAYGAFAALAGVAGWLAMKNAAPAPARTTMTPAVAAPAPAAVTVGARLRWVGLALVPSSLMLGATQYLTTDVAPVPLLWIAPLAIYLLTFMLAFGTRRPRWLQAVPRLFPVAAVVVTMLCFTASQHSIAVVVVAHLGLLLLGALLCHGRLRDERPAPEQLTEYYLLIAVGGVLGGAFNALLAPVLFNDIFEYPIALVLAALALPVLAVDRRGQALPRLSWLRQVAPALLIVPLVLGPQLLLSGDRAQALPTLVVMVLPAYVVYSFARRRLRFAVGLGLFFLCMHLLVGETSGVLKRQRSFFGVHVVTRDQNKNRHLLTHGSTLHGLQDRSAGHTTEPLSYYSRGGPVGQVFASYGNDGGLDDVAVLGLGAGTLAAYGAPHRHLTFYEIDPGIIQTASDPALFSFVHDSTATVAMVAGDGRLGLGHVADGKLAMVVADAFSSDAVPVHLLTKEALALYFRKLRPDGLLLMNISNRYFRLQRVVGALADDLGLHAIIRDDHPPAAALAQGITSSMWVVVARQDARLQPLLNEGGVGGWQVLHARAGDPRWTDEISNVVRLLRWLSSD